VIGTLSLAPNRVSSQIQDCIVLSHLLALAGMTWYLMKIGQKEEKGRNKKFKKIALKGKTVTRETQTEAIIEIGIMKKRKYIRVVTEARKEIAGERREKGEIIGVKTEMRVEIEGGMREKRETTGREVVRERDISIMTDITVREIMMRGLTGMGELEIIEGEICSIFG
jgi:hypothetical protein